MDYSSLFVIFRHFSTSCGLTAAWLALVLIAQDLLAWAQALCFDGALGTAEPSPTGLSYLRRDQIGSRRTRIRSSSRTTMAPAMRVSAGDERRAASHGA